MYAVTSMLYVVKHSRGCAETSGGVQGCKRLTLRGGLIFPLPLPAREDMIVRLKGGLEEALEGVGSKRSSFGGQERLF